MKTLTVKANEEIRERMKRLKHVNEEPLNKVTELKIVEYAKTVAANESALLSASFDISG